MIARFFAWVGVLPVAFFPNGSSNMLLRGSSRLRLRKYNARQRTGTSSLPAGTQDFALKNMQIGSKITADLCREFALAFILESLLVGRVIVT